MSYYDYGYPMVAWRSGGSLGALGDETAVLADLGFDNSEISTIMTAFKSGSLSSGGYQALLNGYIPPTQLADFLQSDPGATGVATTSGRVGVSDVNTTLAPGPSPTVVGQSPFAWLKQSTIIAGVQNWAIVGLAALFLIGGGAGKRKSGAKL